MSIETQIFLLEEMLLFAGRKVVSSRDQFLFSHLCDWAMTRAAMFLEYYNFQCAFRSILHMLLQLLRGLDYSYSCIKKRKPSSRKVNSFPQVHTANQSIGSRWVFFPLCVASPQKVDSSK